MQKIKILFIILSVCLVVLCGCNNSNDTNYEAEKTSYSTASPPTKKEIEIASFTTNILDQTPSRTDNIALTCSKINGIIVKNGETFSFCDTVGEVSASTGYKEADVLDAEGKTFKGFGGGNCQVSSTLYNAILLIPNIQVLERHEHSKRVYYVEKDKDAAVDSASKLDFKFINNTGNDIKIYASSTTQNVIITIVSIQ